MPLDGVVEVTLVMLAFSAMTAMIALSMSLKFRRTIGSVIWTVAVVGAAALGASACGLVGARNIPLAGPLLGMVSPFVAIEMAISPHEVAVSSLEAVESMGSFRAVVLVECLFVTGLYCLFVWGMYRSMVKTFDMTIRRQSR